MFFKQIINKFSSKLFNKVFLIFTVVIIQLLILFSIVTTSYVNTIIIKKDIAFNKYVLVNLNDYMQSKINSTRQITRQINMECFSKNDPVFPFLEDSTINNSINIVNYKEFVQYFNSLFSLDLHLNQIEVYRNIDSSDFIFFKKTKSQSEVQVLAEHSKSTSSNILISESKHKNKHYEYSMYLNLKNSYTFKNVAVLNFSYSTEYIAKLIDSYYEEDPIKNYLLILTPTGNVIYDSSNTYYEQKYPYIQTLLTNPSSLDINGQTFYVNQYSNNENDLLMVSIIPKSLLSQNANKINIIILVGSLVAMILVPIFAYLVSKHFTKRINSIKHNILEIESGNISWRIPLGSAQDEITDISMSINHMCDEIESYIEKVYLAELNKKSIELSLKNAQLKALQSQIEPHFLYNILESIRMKANLTGAREAGDMIMILAKLYRSSIKEDSIISIYEEIHISKLYLKLYEFKYEDLVVSFHIDDDILDFGIPRHVLQPILENCIVHGYDQNHSTCITIKGYMNEDFICFIITDNGIGITSDRLEQLNNALIHPESEAFGSSIGLSNVHERLKLLFGGDCGLAVHSNPNTGTEVILKIYPKSIKELMSYV